MVRLLLPLALQAAAWSPDGHERIARIAQGLLEGKHRDQVRSMMHSDVIDVSDWEKKMTKQFPDTDALHWHRQEPEWTCGGRGGLGDTAGHVRCDGHGAENGSLFCALAYFFEHFAHETLLREFPAPKEPIGTPESLPVLRKVPEDQQKPAQYLRWLVILVGDLHQPMHWLHEHSYGRDVMIRFRGEERNLLEFWEEFMPQNMERLQDGTYHPDPIDAEYGKRTPAWENKVPTELFREWAKEAAEKVCTEVYAPMTVNHADGTRVESPFDLTEELYTKWLTTAKELMNLGGERLAFVLNEILEHKKHKQAEKEGRGLPSKRVAIGTEVQTADTPSGQQSSELVGKTSGHVAPDSKADDLGGSGSEQAPSRQKIKFSPKKLLIVERQRSRRNAMYNACFAIVIVPSLLFLLNWHQRLGGVWITPHLKM